MREFNKLVRDRIPEIIERNGEVAECRTLNQMEFRFALLDKLIEESKEFAEASAGTLENLLTEAADCKEVFKYMLGVWQAELDVSATRPLAPVSNDPRKDLPKLAERIYDARHDRKVLIQALANYRRVFELAIDDYYLHDKLHYWQRKRAKDRGQFAKRIWLIRTYTPQEKQQAAH